MPLRIAKRKDTGTLWITGTIRPAGAKQGYRVRQRAGSDSEAAAREEAAAIELQILRNHHLGGRPVERGFAFAVTSYLETEQRSPGTVAIVARLLHHFGNVPLSGINQEAVDRARPLLLKEDAAPGTVRRNLIVPLRAILMHAYRRGWCDAPRFELPPEPEGRTDFLLPEQAERLLANSGHIRPLLTYLLCTGCRIGEALALDWSQVDLRGARANVWGDQTKAGRRRVVELPPAAVAALGGLAHRDGFVFLRGDGEPYRATGDGGGHVAGPWGVACRKAGLPGVMVTIGRADRPSQAKRFVPAFGVHVLRHTWSSWRYALHPDPFVLQRAGGWSSVALVERYAHLMPSGHEAAIRRVWGLGELVVVEKRA
jgi:integrase